MVVVPVAVSIAQVIAPRPAVEFMQDGPCYSEHAPLIADIERYRAVNGRYPASLLSVWPDYLPSVIGIERYYHEAHALCSTRRGRFSLRLTEATGARHRAPRRHVARRLSTVNRRARRKQLWIRG